MSDYYEDNWENEGGFVPRELPNPEIEWGYCGPHSDGEVCPCSEELAMELLDSPGVTVYTRVVLPWREY